MSRCFHARVFAALMVAALMLPLVHCGGGGGDSGSPPSPPTQPLNFASPSVPNAVNGQPYNFTFQASGGRPPYQWALDAVSPPLPTGLALSPAGVLSGTPNVSSGTTSFPIMLLLSDAAGQRISATYPLRVAPTLLVAAIVVPNLRLKTYAYLPLSASGGLDGYNWSLATGSGPLPSGMNVLTGGALEGSPQEMGTFNVTLQVRDLAANAQTVTAPLSITVLPPLLSILNYYLSDCVVTRSYSETLVAQGGIPPYTWSVSGLPATLTVGPATGVISGAPVDVATYNLSVQVTDSGSPPQVVGRNLSLAIQPELSILTTSLPRAVTRQFYANSIEIQGGRPPFSSRITAGALPPGIFLADLTINRIIPFSYSSTVAGDFYFTVEITDGSVPPSVATKDLMIHVVEQMVIQPTILPYGIVGEPYSQTLTVANGVPPYTWTFGYVPPGLTLSPAGELSGTPSATYDWTFPVFVTDSDSPPQMVTAYPAIRIVTRLMLNTSMLPSVRLNQPLRVALVAAGGTGAYNWAVSSGSLPAELTLGPTSGEITGTPVSAGPANFTVQVMDVGPPLQTVARTYTLNVTDTMGRNDSIVTATPLSNGTYFASISPTADPEGATANADNDYYQLTAAGGSTVIVETFAERLSPYSPLDTVIEIVDGAGVRLNTCSASGYTSSEPCMNDDVYFGNTLDSRLYFYVPGNPTTTFTFYLRVLDWSGSARPDFLYSLKISGVK